ncbi:MAG: iron ABC transporter permease [Desulfobacterales bacterium]|nr:iron ABC transporter permease [Desulfobacterales bacterium]
MELWPQLLFLGIFLCMLAVAASTMGYMKVGFMEVIRILAIEILGQDLLGGNADPVVKAIVLDVRIPRILTAVAVGGTLAVSGAVFQGILLNPLADPYTLGVSAGAAFGASIALLLNIALLGSFNVPLFAFIGALVTLAVVMYLSSSAGNFSSNNLILSGVIVAAILSAGISFLKYMADEQVSVIIFWLMGSLNAKSWTDVFILLFFSRDLNLMSLGEKTAGSLGVDHSRMLPMLLVTASLMAAVCVSVSGIIGFVGLLVPHMARMAAGPDNRRLIPVSFLCGGILLLSADTVTRAMLPVEVPIGVLTALIGGPFFCYIFRKRQTRHMKHGF